MTDRPGTAERRTERGGPAISAEGLTKVYDGPEGELRAVDDVSVTIDPGTVVGVLGPNGAGKTTLIKSILGLIIPTSGTARIEGIDVHADPGAVYRHAGAMLEGARNVYWRLTVRENLEFFASLVGHSPGAVRERHDELLDRFDLREKADEPVKELSRGMKQKVSLASTLSRGGSVLFLDEPTLGLDVESSVELRRELRELVEDGSMTVVLSSHDMDVIEELCDRVIIMSDGRIIADDTVENLTGVFSSQAYEVTIDGRLPGRTRQTVEHNHTVESWESTPGGSDRFEVVLEDGHELYDLVGALEASGRPIAAIDAIQPDLESAFLDITNRGGTESAGADSDRQQSSSADANRERLSSDGADRQQSSSVEADRQQSSSADATTPEPDGGSKQGESR